MKALQKIDEMSLRATRAREILAVARRNVVGHMSRDARVAAELRLARENIVKFDPKRLASTEVQRQAAAARRERVGRVLAEARRTLARTAHIKPPSSMPGEILYKTNENGRATPVAPAPRQKEAPPSAREHGLNSQQYPIDQRERLVLEAVGEVLGQGLDELRDETRRLRAELVEAKIAGGEAKVALLATQMELTEVRRVLVGRGLK